MTRTGFVVDERFMDHVTGPYHPESPERLKSIYAMQEDEGLNKACASIQAREAGVKELCEVFCYMRTGLSVLLAPDTIWQNRD